MPRLRFDGFGHSPRYASAEQSEWWAGEVRDVSEAQAVYLLDNFPGAFVAPGAPEESPAPAEVLPIAADAPPAPVAPPVPDLDSMTRAELWAILDAHDQPRPRRKADALAAVRALVGA